MRVQTLLCASMATAALAAGPAAAEADELTRVMYGLDRDTATLVRHEMGTNGATTVDTVRTDDGTVLYGIDGAAYVPGFQHIFAFWTDPNTYRGHFAYVNVHDGRAVIQGEGVEGGRVTGATAIEEGDNEWAVYAVQRAETTPPQLITGDIGLNPNNSDDMEFDLMEVDDDGNFVKAWTRDDLLNAHHSQMNGDTLIDGYASSFRIRPKGGGGQSTVQLGDEAITLRNSNTYTFTSSPDSPMRVRVYNNHPSDSTSMGHWRLAIEGGHAYQGEEAEVVTPRRLIRVTHQPGTEIDPQTDEELPLPTGTVTELFPLSRDYDSLASVDGQIFYATSDNRLYRIDRNAETESHIANMPVADVSGFEYLEDEAVGFEINGDRFGTVDVSDGQFGSLKSVANMREFGSIVFCSELEDPVLQLHGPLAAFD